MDTNRHECLKPSHTCIPVFIRVHWRGVALLGSVHCRGVISFGSGCVISEKIMFGYRKIPSTGIQRLCFIDLPEVPPLLPKESGAE